MTAENQHFKIAAGDTKKLRFTIKMDEAVDLTGAQGSWWAAVSNPPPESGAAIQKSAAQCVVSQTDGVWTLETELIPADTGELAGDFYHEARIYKDSDPLFQFTIATGIMTVRRTFIRPLAGQA